MDTPEEKLVTKLGIYDHPDIIVDDYVTAEQLYLRSLPRALTGAQALVDALRGANPTLNPIDPGLHSAIRERLYAAVLGIAAALTHLSVMTSFSPDLQVALPHVSGDTQTAFLNRPLTTPGLAADGEQA